MEYLINGLVIFLLLMFFIILSIESSNQKFSFRKIFINSLMINFKNSFKSITRRFE